jgi:hypothetical protein
MMNDGTLIEKLGNTSALARELNIPNRRVVSNWKQRGIPAKYRKEIKKLADKKNIKVPTGFLDPRPRRRPGSNIPNP